MIQIPLIDNKDNTLACLVGIACNLFILFGNAINGIEDLPQTKESQTVRSEVYTIDGKRIEADQMGRGLYIIRDIQADGSVHTRKVMRK